MGVAALGPDQLGGVRTLATTNHVTVKRLHGIMHRLDGVRRVRWDVGVGGLRSGGGGAGPGAGGVGAC